MFRDQSQSVIAKGIASSSAQTNTTGKTRSHSDSDSPESEIAKHAKPSRSASPRVIPSPKLNEDRGLIDFFANNFTCNPSNRGNNLFWIPSNFDDLLKEDCARYSVQSVGAMALARLQRSPYHYREAQKNYSLAVLNLTEFWRQNGEGAVKDAVLYTVLFLSFFEILASYDESSRQSWTTHLGGLGLLLKQRGGEFLSGSLGVRMLLQSRSQVILDALQTKRPVPEQYQSLKVPYQSFMPPQFVPSVDADRLLIRLATLQAQSQVSGPSTALISELVTLDNELFQWTQNLPSAWGFSSQPCDTSSNYWWEARYDVYSMAIMAHVWNKVRAARIVVHDLIQDISSHFSSHVQNDVNFALSYPNNPETPTPKIRHLVSDICATIPIFYRPSSANLGPDSLGDRPVIGTTYWLLWVLEIVGSTREAPVHLKIWIRQTLERIYETTGIVRAQMVAQRLALKHGDIAVPVIEIAPLTT